MSDLHAATEAWLIRMSDGTRFIHGHNAIGDYRAIDPDATVTELVPRAALSAPAVPQWMPIETAPKDGTHILLACGKRTSLGGWLSDIEHGAEYEGQIGMAGWWSVELGANGDSPTHWMPLPAAPSAKEPQT